MKTGTGTITDMPIPYKASMWLRSAPLPLMDRRPHARRSALFRRLPRVPPSIPRRQGYLRRRLGTSHMPTSTVRLQIPRRRNTTTLRLLQARRNQAMARPIELGIKGVNPILRLYRHPMQATDKIHTLKAIPRSSQRSLSEVSTRLGHLGHTSPMVLTRTRSLAILPQADSMSPTPVSSRTRQLSARPFTGATTDIPSSTSAAGQRTCRLLAIRRRK